MYGTMSVVQLSGYSYRVGGETLTQMVFFYIKVLLESNHISTVAPTHTLIEHLYNHLFA